MSFLNAVVARIVGENKVLPKGYSTFEVFGAAYDRVPGRGKIDQSMLTHTCKVDEKGYPEKVLCGRVKLSSVADDLEVATDELPTCEGCLAKVQKLLKGK